ASWVDGAAAVARPLGSDTGIKGTLSIASFPSGTKGEESTFEATVALEASAPGLVPGMHASVEIGDAKP
ncbi:MAG: hypothetical protein O7B99_15530, partial [Planctomycetota bacterium]|nr:hypothetical protein [Planctomycetota bacterium]